MTTRGTSNRNSRGNSASRRARRAWLVRTYASNRPGKCRCYRCGRLLDESNVTVDRIVPGCLGGRYTRDNIRPACGPCNSETGGALRGGGGTMTAAEFVAVIEGRAPWCVVEGDCLEVLPLLPAKSVSHVITDPPYSEHVHSKVRRGGSAHAPEPGKPKRATISTATVLGFDAITRWQRFQCAAEFSRIVRRWVLEFCDDESAGAWVEANRSADLDHVRVGHWWKLGATPQFTGDRPATGAESIVIAHPSGRKRWNGGGRHATWAHPVCNDGDRVHTTQKPLSLMLELVDQFTDEGDVVIDPFAGSGTTGVACLRLGRRFIGVEREPKHAAIARERLEAEARGLSLRDARAGQTSLFDAGGAA